MEKDKKPREMAKEIIKGVIVSALAAYVAMGCGQDQPDPNNKEDWEPKFFSEKKPGKWQNYQSDHIPNVSLADEGDVKSISVSVPFVQSPSHYAEVIVLADHNHNELEAIRLKKGEAVRANFTLPAEYRSKAYVIIKCNLHDMWEKEIDMDL